MNNLRQSYAQIKLLPTLLEQLKGSVKNRICSTTMKLRKSLVKPVTWQNISS